MSTLPPARYPSALDVHPQATASKLFAPGWISQIAPGRLVGILSGCWMSLYCFADFFLRPRSNAFVQTFETRRYPSTMLAMAFIAVVALGALPMVLAALRAEVDFRRVKMFFSVALLICFSISLSYLTTSDIKGLGYLLLVATMFGYLMVGASANLDPERFLQGLGYGVATSQAAIMSIVLIDHDTQWGRLFGHNSSNYWGMSAQATIISCVAIKNRPLQFVAVGVSLATMLWSQSRGSMLATAVGVLAVVGVLSLTRRLSAWIWLSGPALIVPAGVLGLGFFSDKILLWSDPVRGVGSGFTGRTDVWRETLNLFYEHPLFGVGYRQHEQYLTSAASAHNAYLATLADVGLFGLLAYLLLVFGALAMALSKVIHRPTSGRLMTVAYLSAYIVNGLFERNALNTGDFYSVLAIVICVWSWRADNMGAEVAVRRVGASFGQGQVERRLSLLR